MILELKGIYKDYQQGKMIVPVLKDVNFSMEEGEYVAIMGPSGSGKSTLMNVLSGIYPYGSYEGNIIYDGEICKFNTIKDSEHKGIVIIHQELALIPYMTIGENMYLGNERGKSFSINWNETYGEADKYLKIVGLEESSRTLIKDIGVGKQQLVEIAKALAKNAKLLILDEPTAMLDPNGRKEVLEAVRELNRKEKVTVILITHYMEEVIHADRVYVMDSGNVVMQGNPKEIFSQVDTLKKYGLDVPQVTLLAYELKKSGVDVPDGILTTEELVSALCQSN